MEEGHDTVLKTLCCTCLSLDRKLFQLCRVVDGINNLYLLLSYDSEAFKQGFYKDTTSLFICWECRAVMSRLVKFRNQACAVQRHLTDIVDGRSDVKLLNMCLSQLTTTSDHEIIDISDGTDNFIDCGVTNMESDGCDDVPLSEIHKDDVANEIVMEKKKVKLKKRKKTQCKPPTNNKDYFKNEMKIDKDEKLPGISYKCDFCQQVFKSEFDLEEHKGEIDSEHTKKHTKKANKSTLKVSRSRRHISKDNTTLTLYKCPECNKVLDSKNKQWKHVQKYHREHYPCSTCGKKFAFKNTLNRHESLHKSPLPREECQHCHKLIRIDLVKIHARIHTKREQYCCAECDKRFVSRASYEHHLKYSLAHQTGTDRIFKHKCSMCDKGYRSRGELRDHVNYNHLGKTKHKCPVCAKPLASRRCITKHVKRAHDGIKENARDKICQQCGKTFRDKKGLREHEFIHTGERPLSCEICGCTFRQNASLYTHKKRVHKIYPPRKHIELLEGLSH